MNFSAMAHVLGLVGVTPVRAFLPAFLTALFIRIGGIPYLSDTAVNSATAAPSWFTHDYTLIILGLLSIAEIFATKSPELRDGLNTVDQYYKPVLAALTSFGVITTADASAAEVIHGGTTGAGIVPIAMISLSAISFGAIWTILTTGVTFFACMLRSGLMELLEEFDPDGSTGIHSLIAWAEDTWVVVLVVLLFLIPVIILTLVAVCLLGLWMMQRHYEKRVEASKVECQKCDALVLPFATRCHACKTPRIKVSAIGFLGQKKEDAASDLKGHRLRLISMRKCPACASKLAEKRMDQVCPVCGHSLLAGDHLPGAYLEMIRSRLPHALLICGLLSAIPIVGAIPAIVYYRVVLISPFRMYIGIGSSFASRWISRIIGFVLIMCFSWVPVLSAIVAPALAMMNYAIYRRAFMKQFECQRLTIAKHADS